MRFPGFIGPSYTQRSKNADCQRCVNLYPELNENGTGKEKEIACLIGTPGLSLKCTLGSGPIRGLYVASNDILFACSGNKLYRITSAYAGVEIGTLLTSSGHVDMADNGSTLVIVDGDNGYTHTIGSATTSQITDSDFLGADRVDYMDGYFIFNDPDSGTFYLSGLNDVTFDALDVASADSSPDNIISLLVDHRELWLFGAKSIEVWYNSGAADFPFERVSGAVLEAGCAAAFSVAKMGKSVFWLGRDESGNGIVYMSNGFQPQRISTHAVELAIQSYGDISDAVAYTYQQEGHSFYVINFTSANTTWAYDLSTGLWHERAFTNAGILERHRANYHAFAYNAHIVGDFENGKLYELDLDIYTDNSEVITRLRVSPHVYSGGKRLFYSSFELDMETGVGLVSGQGSDPQAILTWSDDGGHTWSNEKWASLGAIGNRKTRAVWRRLGSAYDRVFQLKITDPVKVVLLGAELEVEAGAA